MDHPYYYISCIVILLIVLTDVGVGMGTGVVEHLQISGEAIQNVGSIYNANKMIVKDLEVTGDLKVGGNATIKNGDIAAKLTHIYCDKRYTIASNGCGQEADIHRYNKDGGWETRLTPVESVVFNQPMIMPGLNVNGNLNVTGNVDSSGISVDTTGNVKVKNQLDVAGNLYAHAHSYFHAPGHYMNIDNQNPKTPFTAWSVY